jgi:hypothetical protein
VAARRSEAEGAGTGVFDLYLSKPIGLIPFSVSRILAACRRDR